MNTLFSGFRTPYSEFSSDIWTRLKTDTRPVVLYGTGNGADRIIDILEKENIKISGIFSSAAFVRDRFFRGIKVTTLEECRKNYPDMLVLMCFGSCREEVLSNVCEIGRNNEILAPDVPVYGDNVFTYGFYLENKEKLDTVRQHLSDEKSIITFDRLVHFKLTGDISDLFLCEADNDGIFSIKENSVFLDLGAYNGDTVAEFIQYCPDYKEIIAVEPDRRSFRKLTEATKELRTIKTLNVGISHSRTTVRFEQNAGRQSKIGKGEEIPAESVDSILSGGKVDFINVDVEGAESDMIKGARNTILLHRPKMLISAYHRTEDYFAIVKSVLDIRDDYKVYMRHFKSVPAWDTVFYFV